MQLQKYLWEHFRTLHNAWSSFWFIASWRCDTLHDAHLGFLYLKMSCYSSSWPLLDQCVSITRLVRTLSPFFVGRVHVHTLTLNIQAVRGQTGRESMARGFRMVFSFDVSLFSLRCGCFWRCGRFFFFWTGLQQEILSNIVHYTLGLVGMSNDADADWEVYFTPNKGKVINSSEALVWVLSPSLTNPLSHFCCVSKGLIVWLLMWIEGFCRERSP